MFNAAYSKMLANGDRASAKRLRKEYVAFTSAQIDYFAELDRKVWGYEPAEIMLLHDNRLNADTIEQVLGLFEKKGYRWVSLADAERDPTYMQPDTVVTRFGPMWGHRWARQRDLKVEGSLEPEPPSWISQYGQEQPIKRRPRSVF